MFTFYSVSEVYYCHQCLDVNLKFYYHQKPIFNNVDARVNTQWVHKCVLACKIWPLFKKMLGKRYPFLRWNQEIFNSLKQPFFSKSRKKVKTFQKTLFLRKQEKCLNDDFSQYL